jgi:hypothetical protein
MNGVGRVWLAVALLALLVLVAPGCARRHLTLPNAYPTRGRLTWHGEPVRYAIVDLDPLDTRGAEADAMTDEDGTFELRSFANDGTRDGVVPGKYRVTLEEYDPTRAVRVPVQPGSRPTPIPGGEWTWDGTLEVAEGEAEITIDLP